MTILEVLVSLAVFSICLLGIVQSQRAAAELAHRAEKKDLALIVAEDLYEEMLSVPFAGVSGDGEPGASRPRRFGNLLAYNGFSDSPVHDILDQEVSWGRELSRKVTVRQFTPDERMRVLPPMTAPLGEYAECQIQVIDVKGDGVMAQMNFVRAL